MHVSVLYFVNVLKLNIPWKLNRPFPDIFFLSQGYLNKNSDIPKFVSEYRGPEGSSVELTIRSGPEMKHLSLTYVCLFSLTTLNISFAWSKVLLDFQTEMDFQVVDFVVYMAQKGLKKSIIKIICLYLTENECVSGKSSILSNFLLLFNVSFVIFLHDACGNFMF